MANYPPAAIASCSNSTGEDLMPQFLIERQIPGAGKLSSAELKAISQKIKAETG